MVSGEEGRPDAIITGAGELIERRTPTYADHQPCDFDADVRFVNAPYTDAKPLMLPAGDATEHREEERERLDATTSDEGGEQIETREIAYADDLVDLLKMNFAFKTLGVLGQVLRNFPGSLDRDMKREIAKVLRTGFADPEGGASNCGSQLGRAEVLSVPPNSGASPNHRRCGTGPND